MSIKISFNKNLSLKLVKNYVLFCNEEFKIFGLDSLSIKNHSKFIKKTVLSNKSKKNEHLMFNLNSEQKIILIKRMI